MPLLERAALCLGGACLIANDQLGSSPTVTGEAAICTTIAPIRPYPPIPNSSIRIVFPGAIANFLKTATRYFNILPLKTVEYVVTIHARPTPIAIVRK